MAINNHGSLKKALVVALWGGIWIPYMMVIQTSGMPWISKMEPNKMEIWKMMFSFQLGDFEVPKS